MDDRENALRARARRAYEVGRLRAAVRRAALLLPVVAVVLLCCAEPTGSLPGSGGLIVLVTFCLWRGQEYGRGVRPGIIAGFVPLLLPLLAQAGGHPCVPGRCLVFPVVCVAGGVIGGVALGLLAPRPAEGRRIPFVTASLIAGLAGSVGCVIYGLIGLAGMTLGLVLGATPILTVRRA
jgi:hypothetical protein